MNNCNREFSPCFVGIDLAFAKKKYLPIVICTWEQGCLFPYPLRNLGILPPRGKGNVATLNNELVKKFAKATRLYIKAVCVQLKLQPMCIGIDAPSAPRDPELRRRLAELALDRAGISCFATPSEKQFDAICDKVNKHLEEGGDESHLPHANQLWMLVGFAVFKELQKLAPCIEVFPQATARALGVGQIHKSQPGAVDEQLNAAAKYTGWLPGQSNAYGLSEIAWGDRHDQLDAYLSAWVASLEEDKRKAFGDPSGDAIWIPKIKRDNSMHSTVVMRKTTSFVNSKPLSIQRKVKASKLLCPGCGKKEFKQWPLGWDGHAAFKCEGLSAVGPEERKNEFRRKYLGK